MERRYEEKDVDGKIVTVPLVPQGESVEGVIDARTPDTPPGQVKRHVEDFVASRLARAASAERPKRAVEGVTTTVEGFSRKVSKWSDSQVEFEELSSSDRGYFSEFSHKLPGLSQDSVFYLSDQRTPEEEKAKLRRVGKLLVKNLDTWRQNQEPKLTPPPVSASEQDLRDLLNQ